MIRPSIGALVGALLFSAASEVRAQPAPANEARVAFQDGVRHYAEQHFAEALESFRRAYRVRPHPSVLVNIANCYLALNQPQQAVTTFERFLNDPTNAATPQQRTAIERGLEEARRQLATIQVRVEPAGAEVFLDGDLVGNSPLRRPLVTGPGPHVLEARGPNGAMLQFQARVNPGGTLTVTLDLANNRSYVGSVPPGTAEPAPLPTPPPTPAVTPPIPPPPTVSAAPPPRTAPAPPPLVVVSSRVQTTFPVVAPPRGDGRVPASRPSPSVGLPGAFWGGLAATLALGGAAVGFAVYAESLARDYNGIVVSLANASTPADRDYFYRQGLSFIDAVDQNRLIAYVFGGLAGAAAVFTVVSPFVFRRAPRRAPQRSLFVAPAPDGRGAVLSGTF